MIYIREWLSEIRQKQKISQGNVACKAGISQSYYCDIEKGNKVVGDSLPVSTAKNIAIALNFDWTKFYENDLS